MGVTKLKEPRMAEIGTTGLKHNNGYLIEEFHSDLKGQEAAKKYREMGDNNPILGVALSLVELTARRTKYSIDTARDADGKARMDPEAERAQRHIETSFEDVDGGLPQLVGWGCSNVMQYGYALCEPVMKIRGGDTGSRYTSSKFDDRMIGWLKFGKRRQDSIEQWDIDEYGEWIAAWQRAAPLYKRVRLERERLLHFKLFDANGSPEGKSMFRPAYESYYHLRNHQFIESVGADRDLSGFPDAQVPAEVLQRARDGDSDATAIVDYYKQLVANMRTDSQTGLVRAAAEDMDGKTGYDFGLISSGSRNLGASDVIIRRYRAELALAMHTQMILVAQDSVGAQSSMQGHTDLYAIAVEGLIDCILQTLNEVAIPDLLRLNGIDRSAAPRISRGPAQRRDLAALAQILGATVGSGIITPDDALEVAVREAADLPPVDTGTRRAPAEPTAADMTALIGETFGG